MIHVNPGSWSHRTGAARQPTQPRRVVAAAGVLMLTLLTTVAFAGPADATSGNGRGAGASARPTLVTPVTPTVAAPAPASLTVTAELSGRAAPSDQLAVGVSDGLGHALAAASTQDSAARASTRAVVAPDQPYTLLATITPGPRDRMASYRIVIACTDSTGARLPAAGNGPVWTVVPAGTGTSSCTVSAAPRPAGPPRTPTPTPDPATPTPTPTPTSDPATPAPPTGELDTTMTLADVNGDPVPAAGGLSPGDVLDYQITVTNTGDGSATTVLTESIPVGTSYTGTGDWTLDGASATEPIEVAAQSARVVRFQVTVSDPPPAALYSVTNAVASSVGTCTACSITSATSARPSTSMQLVSINGGSVSPVSRVSDGDRLTYRITVSNDGGTAGHVELADAVPAQSTFSGGADENWSVVDSIARQRLAVAAAGGESAAQFTVTVDNPLPAPVVDITNRLRASAGSCASCVVATPVAAFGLSTSASSAIAHPGDQVTYTITVHNRSAHDYTSADPLQFSDDLRGVLDDASYDNDATGGGVLTGPVLSWALALDAGATAVVTYSVTVSPVDAGDHVLSRSLQTPPDSAGNCPTGWANPVCTPASVAVQGYSITLTASPSSVNPGQSVRYTINVHNTGVVDYSAAEPARFAVDLADVLDDATLSSTGGGSRLGTTLTWGLPLAVGGSASVAFTVRIDDADTGNQALRATVTTPPGTGGNCSSASALACRAGTVGVQSYSVTLRASTSKPHPGDVVTYTITIRNTGTIDYTRADPARVSDDLAGVLDDSVYQDDVTGDAGLTDGVLSWRFPLEAGTTVTLRYSVVVTAIGAGDHRLVNSVQTSSPGGNCPAGSDDSACSPDPSGVQAFTVAKTSSVTTTAPGGIVTYTITVHNTGAVDYTESDPARFEDDLSGVLDDADYRDDATGSPTRAGNVLSWALALPAGASTTVTYSFLVRPPDSGDHELLNRVVTRAGGGGNCPAGSTDLACAPPPAGSVSYAVSLTADRTGAAPGAIVTYTVTVTNTGATAYTAAHPATFTNDLARVLDDATYNQDATGGAGYAGSTLSWSGPLSVGASSTVRYSVTINRRDRGDAVLTNVIATPSTESANCTPGTSSPSCASTVDVARLELVVVATSPTMRAVGDVATYTFTVRNTGHIALNSVRIDQLVFGGHGAPPDLSGCVAPFAVLAPGVARSCTATYSITQADLTSGAFTNTAQAHALDPLAADVESNESSATIVAAATLTLTMTAVTTDVTGDGLVDAGDRIDWEITVANRGRSIANSLNVSAGRAGPVTCNHTALAEGKQTRCMIATYRITRADTNTTVTNTAVAIGIDLAGFRIISPPASAGVHVSAPVVSPGGSGLTGTSARLLLILVVTIIAAAGLLVLAGVRRRSG